MFITVTCKPSRNEIQNELLPGQTVENRLDLVTTIFSLKYEELKKDVYDTRVLDKVVGHVQVIDFREGIASCSYANYYC